MTCEKCEELRLRVQWLEEELGLHHRHTMMDAVKRAFNLSRMEAWFAMTLWKARGRTVGHGWLLDARPTHRTMSETPSLNMLRVYMTKVRYGLGKDSIRAVWGQGYAMTPEGMAKMDAVLLPLGETHGRES